MSPIYYSALKHLWPIAKFLWRHWQKDTKHDRFAEPSFNRDQDPSDETLERIQHWPYPFTGLPEFIRGSWQYKDLVEWHGGMMTLSTGGCSSNEMIIGALEANYIFWSMCWRKSEVGGHYAFNLPMDSAGQIVKRAGL